MQILRGMLADPGYISYLLYGAQVAKHFPTSVSLVKARKREAALCTVLTVVRGKLF